MTKFRDHMAVQRWLDTKPHEASVVLAARAVLRAVPALTPALRVDDREARKARRTIFLPVFGCLAVAWVAAAYPSRTAALRAAAVARIDDSSDDDDEVLSVTSAARDAARTLRDKNETDPDDIMSYDPEGDDPVDPSRGDLAGDAANAVSIAAHALSEDWDMTAAAADAEVIDRGVWPATLANQSLWLGGMPELCTRQLGAAEVGAASCKRELGGLDRLVRRSSLRTRCVRGA